MKEIDWAVKKVEYSEILPSDIKKDAYGVLEKKCNKCHQKRKRLNIFTFENMDIFAPIIQHQVFVAKRMPKGRTKLAEEELETLKKWLEITLKSS